MEIFSRDGIDYNIEECSVSDIINYNEVLVIQTIRKTLKKNSTICRCPLCIEDLFALTLNALPPRYIQITSTEKYMKSSNFIDEKAVMAKVLESWEKIKKKPNH